MVNKLLLLGGWIFWVFLIIKTLLYILEPYAKIDCYNEVTQYTESPNKKMIGEISIRDCVGGTSDFAGTISIRGKNSPKESITIFEFHGKPSESGLSIEWESNDTIRVKIKTIEKASRLVHFGNDVKVKFEITT